LEKNGVSYTCDSLVCRQCAFKISLDSSSSTDDWSPQAATISVASTRNTQTQAVPAMNTTATKEVCDHDAVNSFIDVVMSSYFTQDYYAKNPSAPDQCATKDCKIKFGQAYKVGNKNPVYCCSNSVKKTNPCKIAYCKPCFDAWLLRKNAKGVEGGDESTITMTTRKRKGTKQLNSY
jgi:hypothetical protein